MYIEDITKQRLSDATDLQLKKLFYNFAKLWDKHFKNNSKENVGCFIRKDFLAKYRLLLRESDSPNRNLQNSTCDIDRQAFSQSMQVKADGIDFAQLSEITTAQNTIILDADFAKSDAGKINIIIKADDSDSESFSELTKIIEEQFDKECVFTYDPDFEGFGIPLYHQILRPVTKIEKVEIKKKKKEKRERGEEIEKDIEIVPVEKGDEQIVYGIVYEPDTVDAQGDQANADEIKKAAYFFMENAQAFKVMHKGKKVKVQILENYIAPVDFTIAKRTVKKGSWVLVTRVLDKKLWEKIKAGDLTGYSMAGRAQVE